MDKFKIIGKSGIDVWSVELKSKIEFTEQEKRAYPIPDDVEEIEIMSGGEDSKEALEEIEELNNAISND